MSDHCADDNELATTQSNRDLHSEPDAHYNNKRDNYQPPMLQENAMHATDEGNNSIAAICPRDCSLSASINEENDNNTGGYPSTKMSEECNSLRPNVHTQGHLSLIRYFSIAKHCLSQITDHHVQSFATPAKSLVLEYLVKLT